MTILSRVMGKQDMLDDEALAAQAKEEPDAFAELYCRHFQAIYRYLASKTGNVQDAQDLTTRTFMAALEGIGSFRGQGSFKAWLFGIARRMTALHYRSLKPEIALDENMNLKDPAEPPEPVVLRRIQVNQLVRLMHQLTDDRAEAVLLCVVGGLTAREASEAMGRSIPAVKMLVHRGLNDLKTKTDMERKEEK